MFGTPNVALVAKGKRPKSNKTIKVGSLRKVRAPFRKVGTKGWNCQEAKG